MNILNLFFTAITYFDTTTTHFDTDTAHLDASGPPSQIAHRNAPSSIKDPPSCDMAKKVKRAAEAVDEPRRATSCNHLLHPSASKITELCPVCDLQSKMRHYTRREAELNGLTRGSVKYSGYRRGTRAAKLAVVKEIGKLEEQVALEMEWENRTPDTNPLKWISGVQSAQHALNYAESEGYFVTWPPGAEFNPVKPKMTTTKPWKSKKKAMVVNPTRKPTGKITKVTEQNEKPKRRVSWDPEQNHRPEDNYRRTAFYHRKSSWYNPGSHATQSEEGYHNTSFMKDSSYFSREELHARLEAEKLSTFTATDPATPIDNLLSQQNDDCKLEAATAQMESVTLEDPEVKEANMTLEQLKSDLKRLEEKFGPRPESSVAKIQEEGQGDIPEVPKLTSTPLTKEALAEFNGDDNVQVIRYRDTDVNPQCGSDSSQDSDSSSDSDEDLDRTLIDISDPIEYPQDESDPEIYGDIASRLRRRSDDDPLVDAEDDTTFSGPHKYNWRDQALPPRRDTYPRRDMSSGGDIALQRLTPRHDLNPEAPSFCPNRQRASSLSSMSAFEYNPWRLML
ncbi:hypothetical protein BU16DRAFT_560862 [Lophium mytilinum]|uniref:Uncharacterized protein n=1 Tax=Lophium mytilinum TaxID=390894 RepID=A0A6A6QWF4_9PEZI|nr:hypothetical protein BU16DRAFT_560862 [Lophium mytilinum]